jgi:hypothetical protein
MRTQGRENRDEPSQKRTKSTMKEVTTHTYILYVVDTFFILFSFLQRSRPDGVLHHRPLLVPALITSRVNTWIYGALISMQSNVILISI